MDMNFDGLKEDLEEAQKKIDEHEKSEVQRKRSHIDGIVEKVGNLYDDGYRHIDTYMIDTGKGRSSNCDYCGTAIRYEFWLRFSKGNKDENGDITVGFEFKVGSTCVEHFQDYLSSFEVDKVMDKFKEYGDLVEEYDTDYDKEVSISELDDRIKEIKKMRRIKKAKDNYPEVYDFLSKKVESTDNDFYESLYNDLVYKGRLTENQYNAIKDDIGKTTELQDEKMIDAMLLKTLLEIESKGLFKFWKSDDGNKNDRDFIKSLYNQFVSSTSWSRTQHEWVSKKIKRYSDNLVKAVDVVGTNGECPECGDDARVFDDRGFIVCLNGHIEYMEKSFDMGEIDDMLVPIKE